MLKKKASKIGLIVMMLAMPATGIAEEGDSNTALTISDTYKIGGNGSWGYLAVDADTHLVYIARGNHLQIIDPDVDEVIGDIANCGANGVALVPVLKKGFTSDGSTNTVTAFDLESRKILYTVPTGQDPDAILYDSASKKIFAFDDKSNDVTVVDPAVIPSLAVTAHIPLDGTPAFAASDGNGHVYVSIQDKNIIQEIDTKALMVSNTWKIDGIHPTGLAMDIQHGRLFCVCDRKMLIVDAAGKTVGTLQIGTGSGACAFDSTTGKLFSISSDGTFTVIKETTTGHFAMLQTLKIETTARTLALDPGTHTVYIPFAKLLPDAGPDHYKPDSFAVLVLTPEK